MNAIVECHNDVCRLVEESGWSGPDDSWCGVRAGDTEPFSFGARRGRAARAHAHQLHQLALRLDGWDPPDPVCVDRVGVYFRHLTHSVPNTIHFTPCTRYVKIIRNSTNYAVKVRKASY